MDDSMHMRLHNCEQVSYAWDDKIGGVRRATSGSTSNAMVLSVQHSTPVFNPVCWIHHKRWGGRVLPSTHVQQTSQQTHPQKDKPRTFWKRLSEQVPKMGLRRTPLLTAGEQYWGDGLQRVGVVGRLGAPHRWCRDQLNWGNCWHCYWGSSNSVRDRVPR